MKSNRPVIASIIFTATVACLLAATSAAAATAQARGAVVGLDLAKSQVALRLADGTRLIVEVRPGTTLLRNTQKVRLPRLTLFDTATVTFRVGNRAALRLEAQGPRLQPVAGAVRDLQIGAGTIRIGGRQLRLDAASRISRNGVAASLSEIAATDQVVAHTAPGGDRAFDLLASGRRLDEIHGTIQAVSAGAITIAPANGTAAVTLGLDALTEIELDDRSVAVVAPPAVHSVAAQFDAMPLLQPAGVGDAAAEPEDAHVRGVVAAVDPGAGNLTITPEDGGAAITLLVLASTEIEVDGEPGSLANIQIGMPVKAEFDLATLEASEIEAGSEEGEDEEDDETAEFEGMVTAVDTAAGTITLAAKSSSGSVTLKVTAATQIEIDDQPGTLADIEVGDEAEAEYFVATLEAKEIEVDAEGDEEEDDNEGEEAKVTGTVAAVDTAAGTVTVDPSGADANVVLTVTAQTEIEIDGELGAIGDIEVGEPVEAEFDADTLVASEIEVGDDD